MPTRPPHPCPSCHTLVLETRYCKRCEQSRHRAREAQRGNRHQRGYTWEYERARRKLLADQPRCHWCGGNATVADHLTPLSAGGTNDPANLVPSCVACNARRITRPSR